MNAVETAVAEQASLEAHNRRLAYIQEQGWRVTPEGIMLDTSDPRWSKRDRILVAYDPAVTFEQGVRSAYDRQKALEAEALATEQRRGRA